MGSDSEARARGAQRKGGEAGREWEGRRGRLEREGGVGGGGGDLGLFVKKSTIPVTETLSTVHYAQRAWLLKCKTARPFDSLRETKSTSTRTPLSSLSLAVSLCFPLSLTRYLAAGGPVWLCGKRVRAISLAIHDACTCRKESCRGNTISMSREHEIGTGVRTKLTDCSAVCCKGSALATISWL